MKRKFLNVITLSLLLTVGFFNIPGIFAKNMNLPTGASDVIYQCGEGTAIIDLPNPVPTNYPTTATKMLVGVHIDSAPSKYAGVRLYIELWEIGPMGGDYSWQPWVEITTNANSQTLMRQFWGGSATEFNLAAATAFCAYFGVPIEAAPYLTTDNVKLVSNDVLKAERHGNNILVTLTDSQQIKQPMSVATYWTLPAFSLELNAYGDSLEKQETFVMSGWPGAWGGTFVTRQMGFNALGTCTCPLWSYDAVQVSNGWVSMNAKQSFYPPL